MIYLDYQVFILNMPEIDGVENGERMWKHSPKSWGMPKYVMRKWLIWLDSNAVL